MTVEPEVNLAGDADVAGAGKSDIVGRVKTWRQTFETELERVSQFGHDWDPYGGQPPSETAVAQARALVGRVIGEVRSWKDQPLPTDVGAIASGGILMIWEGSGREIQVRVTSDGRLDCLVVDDPDSQPRYDERHDLTVPQAAAILARVIGARRSGR